jgi:hypothetical protein
VPRFTCRRWIIEGGVERQAGDETGTAQGADLMEQLQRRITAVSDNDHDPSRR